VHEAFTLWRTGIDPLLLVVKAVYLLTVAWLSIYGIQSLVLTGLYLKNRGRRAPSLPPAESHWPTVAVQLPVYNERHVVERAIAAAAALDYPADRILIQVLDDSSDETAPLADAAAARLRASGRDVQVVRREDRTGFKAGALAYGLRQTEAEFVAIFDADFLPPPDFLRRCIPYLLADRRAGMVQTRWGHINDSYSPLTRAQALALDGHFVVEQAGRSRSGLLINFNGSGGVWRRQCIEDAGGWAADTMTEDMDLSYRAQLAGWRTVYADDVEAPAELPPQMEAFKRQQARWAEGSVQCLRKLAVEILKSPLRPQQKIMALVHISGYLSQPLMLLLLLISVPSLLLQVGVGDLWILLTVATMGPPILYLVAQRSLHLAWHRRLLYFPVLATAVAGMSLSTSVGVARGLTRWGGTFRRTPKFRIEGTSGDWETSSYRLGTEPIWLAEAALFAYALAGAGLALHQGRYDSLPLLLLFAVGYGWVVTSNIRPALHRGVLLARSETR
jgi:cellulose synthase/poly-beta-1,6-N-acetylglucosamine synthase-like glycosyltransferase